MVANAENKGVLRVVDWDPADVPNVTPKCSTHGVLKRYCGRCGEWFCPECDPYHREECAHSSSDFN